FDGLSRNSPGLAQFDWSAYLRCSIARMVHAAASLERRGVRSGRLLDYGSYFGNFSLMCRRLGFDVDAVDDYRGYGVAVAASRELLTASGVRTLDFADVAFDLAALAPDSYDVVICGGVIEHVPHTPRAMLHGLTRVLKPGGLLIIDTPNLAYLANR